MTFNSLWKVESSLRNKWINNYDYYLKKYDDYKNQNRVVDESINYYFGILEYSIFLLKLVDVNYFEYGEKNVALYLRSIFFSEVNDRNEIAKKTIKSLSNAYYDWYLIIVRMICPDYYFKFIDKIICKEEYSVLELQRIIYKREEYKEYLNFIINEINKYKKIEIRLY